MFKMQKLLYIYFMASSGEKRQQNGQAKKI